MHATVQQVLTRTQLSRARISCRPGTPRATCRRIIERVETLPRAALNFVARTVSRPPAARPSKDPSCARQTEDSLRPRREDKTVSNPKRNTRRWSLSERANGD